MANVLQGESKVGKGKQTCGMLMEPHLLEGPADGQPRPKIEAGLVQG